MYQKDGKFYGDNTDYYGFLESLKKYNINVRNKNVSIIGNGGACRAVETVLNDLNANVTKYYRSDKKSSIDFYKNDSCPCGELLCQYYTSRNVSKYFWTVQLLKISLKILSPL